MAPLPPTLYQATEQETSAAAPGWANLGRPAAGAAGRPAPCRGHGGCSYGARADSERAATSVRRDRRGVDDVGVAAPAARRRAVAGGGGRGGGALQRALRRQLRGAV